MIILCNIHQNQLYTCLSRAFKLKLNIRTSLFAVIIRPKVTSKSKLNCAVYWLFKSLLESICSWQTSISLVWHRFIRKCYSYAMLFWKQLVCIIFLSWNVKVFSLKCFNWDFKLSHQNKDKRLTFEPIMLTCIWFVICPHQAIKPNLKCWGFWVLYNNIHAFSDSVCVSPINSLLYKFTLECCHSNALLYNVC